MLNYWKFTIFYVSEFFLNRPTFDEVLAKSVMSLVQTVFVYVRVLYQLF